MVVINVQLHLEGYFESVAMVLHPYAFLLRLFKNVAECSNK